MPKRRANSVQSKVFETVWADLNSFLMIFFLLLYTFSMDKISDQEQLKIYESIRVSLKGSQTEVKVSEKKKEETVVDKVIRYVKEQRLSDYIKIMIKEDKIKIILAQPVLFDTGDAVLKGDSLDVLHDLGKILNQTDSKIVVEGHTDNVPIHNDKYDSNWDLSFDRSYSVVKYFVKELKMHSARMQAIGYGEHRPIVPNDTLENRSQNRRIELNIMLKEQYTRGD